MEKLTIAKAVEKVLLEDKRTRRSEYNWLFLASVLRKMGFKIYIQFDSRMPSPETLFRAKRDVINSNNQFPEDFIAEDGVTIERRKDK